MRRKGWTDSRFLVDGFPRNKDNVDGWNRVMGECAYVPFAVFLDCSEETMIQRIHKRKNETAEDEVRNDDNIEVLKKRFTLYKNETMPIINQFKERNELLVLDANQNRDQVTDDMVRELERIGISKI
uniref:Adenylate kinase n=1 Tax=Strombidium rassoulzadegani TaxID=1082188 RepID=A0A7S3CPE2_9SPIT|mmetsp:Transcript_18901/g.32270  ORF Transcript_18901/g.32270 Transcript_18901/m.32270 type:complete len:127 (+) Transcript_18901:312-692(+)